MASLVKLWLNFYDYRQNHWASLRLLEQEQPDLIANQVLEIHPIDGASSFAFNDKFNLLADLHQQILILFEVNKTAGNNIRTAADMAGL